MSEHNPFEVAAALDNQLIRQIVTEAITDWINRATIPYVCRDSQGLILEMRGKHMFYMQQAVNRVLSDNQEQLDKFLREHMR